MKKKFLWKERLCKLPFCRAQAFQIIIKIEFWLLPYEWQIRKESFGTIIFLFKFLFYKKLKLNRPNRSTCPGSSSLAASPRGKRSNSSSAVWWTLMLSCFFLFFPSGFLNFIFADASIGIPIYKKNVTDNNVCKIFYVLFEWHFTPFEMWHLTLFGELLSER